MRKGEKSFVYWSTMTTYTDFIDFVTNEIGKEYEIIFYMLWSSYNFPALLSSPYFELLRVGDKKYTLILQKFSEDKYKITIDINPYTICEDFCYE